MIFKDYISILLILTTLLVLNIFSTYIKYDIDLSNDKRYTMPLSAKKFVSNLDDNVIIKIYINNDLPIKFKPLKEQINNTLMLLKSINTDKIKFEFINIDLEKNIEQKKIYEFLVKQGLQPILISDNSVGKTTNTIIFSGAIIYYKDRKTSINFIDDPDQRNIYKCIEEVQFNIYSAIKHLLNFPKNRIAILDGNGSLKSNNLTDIIYSIYPNNYNLSYFYDVDRFNLKEFVKNDKVGAGNIDDLSKQLNRLSKYKAVIIAKPSIKFSQVDKFLIDQYIMSGGRVLWLIDGVKAHIDSVNNPKSKFIAVKNDLNIKDLFYSYGVKINNDLIQDLRSANLSIVNRNSNQEMLYKWPFYPVIGSLGGNIVSKNIDNVFTKFTSSIDTIKNNIKKHILLVSSNRSKINYSPVKVGLGILENIPAATTYNKNNLPIAVLLEGKFNSLFKHRIPKDDIDFKIMSPQNKMIVVSDGDIISNPDGYPLGYNVNDKQTYSGNKKFLINAVHYLCDDIEMINLRTTKLQLRLLDMQKIESYKMLIKIFNIVIPILIFLIFQFILHTARKNYYK